MIDLHMIIAFLPTLKRTIKPCHLIIIFFFFFVTSKGQNISCSDDILDEVDVLIGTGANGNVIPVAVTPHGMVQLGPDTRNSSSGYHFGDQTIIGFSHTHKSGGGCSDFQDILLQPTVGKLKLNPGNADIPNSGYRSRFSHEEEHAEPGLYQVKLLDYNIDVELTATKRCGFHQYIFPQGKESHIILDLEHGSSGACTIVPEDNYDTTTVASLKIIDDRHIEGYKISNGWANAMHVYFVMEFSRPFIKHGILSDGIYKTGAMKSSGLHISANFDFDLNENNVVLVKVGISPVSTVNAWKNLKAEIPNWDFNQIVRQNKSAWRSELKKFRVEGGTEKQRKLFMTCLYNVLIYPMLYMDVNGEYRGPDHKIYMENGYNHYSGYIGTWDVFRAANPLLTLIDTEVANDYIKTMLSHYKIYNLLPVWVVAGEETFTMQGFHSVPMIVDTYYKGIRNYDVEKVYDAVKATAMKDTFGVSMRRFVGLQNYKKYNYVPANLEYESVAKTLEYAYDDWTVAQFAKMLGHQKDYKYFIKRSENYKNVFDTTTNFMRGRMEDGTWRTPFDPFYSYHRCDDFMEGNAWQWTFFVPHAPLGLAKLMGGKEKMADKLDSLFIVKSQKIYASASEDLSGMLGQYAHGNEISQHIPYLYNYLGKPWKTQERIRMIMSSLYDTTPYGYCGNEDTGQMSAWYVFSAMGFYPVNQGQGQYIIGTPLFNRIEFNHELGGTLTIIVNNNSDKNIYVQSVEINGDKYTKNWLQHNDIFKKGKVTIEFEMGDKPNYDWGTKAKDCPPSISIW